MAWLFNDRRERIASLMEMRIVHRTYLLVSIGRRVSVLLWHHWIVLNWHLSSVHEVSWSLEPVVKLVRVGSEVL
jgi:hypothetical protein